MWSLCAALVLMTITLHVTGVTFLMRALRLFWTDDVDRDLRFLDSPPGVISVIVAVALILAALHGFESLIWAAAYFRFGALSTMADAILYSIGSMTTRGSSGLHVQPDWRVIGAVEAGDGMLLFGISTAFLFTVMLRLWRLSSPRPSTVRARKES